MTRRETPGFRKIVSPLDQEIQLIPVEGREENPKTIKDLLELYRGTIKPADFSATLSTLTRYTVPAIEGPSPKSSRASSQEIEAALRFLEKKSIWVLEQLEEHQEKYFESVKLPADKRYLPRSILKKLIDWARKQGFLTQKVSKKEIVIYRHTRVPSTPPQKSKPSDSCQFGSKNEDFVKGKNWKPISSKAAPKWQQRFVTSVLPLVQCSPLLIAISWIEIAKTSPPLFLGNPTIDGELLKFINFMAEKMKRSLATTKRDVEVILRILEWLKREEPQLKLDQLELAAIIPELTIPADISIDQFSNEERPGEALWIARSKAEKEMTEAEEKVSTLMSNYLGSLTVTFETQVNYLKSVVNLAKFIYSDKTKDFYREGGYEDIGLIKVLRKLQTEKSEESVTSGQKTEARNRRCAKMVPWPKVLLAVELAVIKFEQKYKYGVNTQTRYKNGSPRISMAIRPERAQFHDLQNALILAMATALPPSRSKVYYQMEIGKTLIKGMLINGVFVSLENLPETKKELATWWLRLTPPDGKKDTIGEEGWQAEIPNRKFSTGKTLYWYLEEWINNWRPKLNPKHNYLYITEKGHSLTTKKYGHKVSNAFRRFIGSPINPHLLRHILITYAYEMGMTDAEKRSLAICQQHSEETQARIYNEQEMLNSLQPALQLNQKFLNEFYQSFDPNQIDPT